MTTTALGDVARERLHNQQLTKHGFDRPEDLVHWMGAVQGQEYEPGKWAIGLRLPDARAADVERAVDEGRILRTWPMRGTIHFVAAKDVRWMLELLAPRTIRKFASYYRRERLDDATFRKSLKIAAKTLEGGTSLPRPALYAALEKAGVRTKKTRGLFILGRLAMEGHLCFGPRQGNQPTFTLLEEWVPRAKTMERAQAFEELAHRYFTSHGPATPEDLAWWAGLTLTEARAALDLAKHRLAEVQVEGETYWTGAKKRRVAEATDTYLLPTYDEFLIGYKDRRAALGSAFKAPPSNLFTATILRHDRVIGFWRRATTKGTIHITARPFERPDAATKADIEAAAQRFGKFTGQAVDVRYER